MLATAIRFVLVSVMVFYMVTQFMVVVGSS